MGFGKFLAGLGAAAGAVIFAPVILPAAAAAGATALATAATAAGTVAAAGTAAVGTVTTVGATIGSAVASTTVGTAAVGAMTTVGTVVGTAAGTVGLTSVATVTGTSAGAAAVGTITTSAAIGATSTITGLSKMSEASDIKYEAEILYDSARNKFDNIEKRTNNDLENLGKTKVYSWNLLISYVEEFEKIKSIEITDQVVIDQQLKLDKNEMENVKVLVCTMKDVLQKGAVSITSGQLIGLATSSGFASIATASTGTAITSLHGVAATNASLAALGGGSLASGGLGMAGGVIVTNALTFAPTLAISGIFINGKGKENLRNAKEIMSEAKKLSNNLEKAGQELLKLDDVSTRMTNTLDKFNVLFDKYLIWLKDLVSEEVNYNNYSAYEKKKLMISYKLAAILKNITCAQIISDDNKINSDSITSLLKDSEKEYNSIFELERNNI